MTKEATGIYFCETAWRIQLESTFHPDRRLLKDSTDPNFAWTRFGSIRCDNFAQQHCCFRRIVLSVLSLRRCRRIFLFPAAIIYPAYIIQSALFLAARESRQKRKKKKKGGKKWRKKKREKRKPPGLWLVGDEGGDESAFSDIRDLRLLNASLRGILSLSLLFPFFSRVIAQNTGGEPTPGDVGFHFSSASEGNSRDRKSCRREDWRSGNGKGSIETFDSYVKRSVDASTFSAIRDSFSCLRE